MAKRILVLGVALMMCLGFFAGCEKYAYQEGDFELTISVENTTVQQGEDFVVDVCFENKSGVDVKISYGAWIVYPVIEGWSYPVIIHYDGPPNTKIFKSDEDYRTTWRIGGGDEIYPDEHGNDPKSLSTGTHELSFKTVITVKKQRIEIWSNVVTLTVE